MMTPTRRTLLKGAGGAMIALAIFPTSSALAAWSGGGQLPMKKDYFDGTAVDHGVEYRRTNMALIPREYRPQITREIVDPEPGRLVIDSREHFLYLTRADGLALTAYPVFSNSSRPISMRRISLVPAPIS
jgi:hypothetical protein